ncbi:MAG: zinc ribbon domain-containing protein [Dehalococcoidia bacterium]
MDVLLSWPGGSWQATARLFGGLISAYLLIIWLASVFWVFRDIRSRTTDMVSHLISVAIAVLFPIVGLPIYLILRPSDTLTSAYDRQLEQEALLSELQTVSACPNCRRPVQDEFTVCAFCATPVKQGCARCGRQLRLSWRYCPYCATPRAPSQAPERERAGGMERPASASPLAQRVSASRDAAVEAIRRAATGGRTAADGPDDGPDEAPPRPRRAPSSSVNNGDTPPAPRPRPRAPRPDGDR